MCVALLTPQCCELCQLLRACSCRLLGMSICQLQFPLMGRVCQRSAVKLSALISTPQLHLQLIEFPASSTQV